MQLKLDPNIPYALALEGGGSKGAYQIGAWKALREAGIRMTAVSGTSVGALNGALIAMGDLEKAENVWTNIRYSQVMDVDDEEMAKLVKGDLRGMDLRQAAAMFMDIVKNRGFDVTPLYEWMKQVVDETIIRASDMELFIVTYSLTDRRELELRARDLPDGAMTDMLLASAYLPVFRNEKLLGKRFTDGGVRDVLPLHVLFANGFKNIIAMRLYGFGVERPVRVPRGTKIHTISPTADLGGTLEFDAQRSRMNLQAGYYDAKRMLYGLRGRNFYVDNRWSEEQAYSFLSDRLRPYLVRQGRTVTLREFNESVLPTMARRLDARKGDYIALLIACLEEGAREAGLEPWHIYTEDELVACLVDVYPKGTYPKAIADALEPRRFAPVML